MNSGRRPGNPPFASRFCSIGSKSTGDTAFKIFAGYFFSSHHDSLLHHDGRGTRQISASDQYINGYLYIICRLSIPRTDNGVCSIFCLQNTRRGMGVGHENVIGMADPEGIPIFSGDQSPMKQKASFSSNTLRPKLWAMAIQPPQTGRIAQPRHSLHPERYLRAAAES